MNIPAELSELFAKVEASYEACAQAKADWAAKNEAATTAAKEASQATATVDACTDHLETDLQAFVTALQAHYHSTSPTTPAPTTPAVLKVAG